MFPLPFTDKHNQSFADQDEFGAHVKDFFFKTLFRDNAVQSISEVHNLDSIDFRSTNTCLNFHSGESEVAHNLHTEPVFGDP